MNKKWVEVSILVSQELADVVSYALSELVSGGIVQERVLEDPELNDLTRDTSPIRVYGYLSADSHLTKKQERVRQVLNSLGKNLLLQEPIFTDINDQDWTIAWQDRYQPIPVGKSLIVVPSWLKNPSPRRTALYIDPSLAFGSGTHPSTQLALVLVESCLSVQPVHRMIDIGCGTGILSIAAAKLGVKEVIGLDIDQDAINISRLNAANNQVEEATRFLQESIKELLMGGLVPSHAPLVITNIIAPTLTKLFGEGLAKLVSPGGTLILSGMLEGQHPEIITQMEKAGFKHQNTLQQDEWVALIGTRLRDMT